MANNEKYRFSGRGVYVIFDSSGCVVEAKGFGKLMWSTLTIDKDIVGKHVEEVAEMIRKYGGKDQYIDFQTKVHIPLLKLMLEQKTN